MEHGAIESRYGNEPEIVPGHRLAGEEPGGPAVKVSPDLIAKAAVILGGLAPSVRTFRTQVFNLRIQMSKMPPKYDKAGNMIEEGYERSAQFRHGVLTTDSPDTILAVEKYSGYGLTVWDDAAMTAARGEIVYEDLVSRAKANPEIFERLKADLNKVDFIEPEEEAIPASPTPVVPLETTPPQAVAKAAKANAVNSRSRGRPKGSKNKPTK